MRKTRKNFFSLIAFLLLLINFSNCKNVIKEINQNDSDGGNAQRDSLIIKWRIDSLGCSGYRSYAIADSIFKRYHLVSKRIGEVREVLGKPNDEWDNESYQGLKYFYDTHCTINTLDTGFDKCWVDILFPKKRAETNSISAACE